jgi:CBS domain-containing protein
MGKVLDARVAGEQLELPRHSRVEPLSLKSVLLRNPQPLICVDAETPSQEVLRKLAEHGAAAAAVMEGGRLIGVFSDCDYARASLCGAVNPASISVCKTMTPCAAAASPTDSVQSCLRLMYEHHLRELPVEENGRVLALVSREELLAAMATYLERVCKEAELDRQIVNLRGTYSC